MRSFKAGLITSSLLTPLLVAGGMLAAAGPVAASTSHGHQAVFVAKNASSTGSGRSCHTARYKTIRSALKAAPPWSAVVVCPGSYHEQVVIKKPVSLIGLHATINQKGVTPTFVVNPPGVGKLTIFAGVVIVSSHVRVQGFTVKNALGEGILAAGVQGTISDISHQAQRGACTTTSAAAFRPSRPTSNARPRGRFPVTAGRACTSWPSRIPR